MADDCDHPTADGVSLQLVTADSDCERETYIEPPGDDGVNLQQPVAVNSSDGVYDDPDPSAANGVSVQPVTADHVGATKNLGPPVEGGVCQ